jgi:DNA-directed RNA polymerase alpha subunit
MRSGFAGAGFAGIVSCTSVSSIILLPDYVPADENVRYNSPMYDKLDIELLELGLDVRACNLVQNAGVRSVSDLKQLRPQQLDDLYGCGKKSRQRILAVVNALNNWHADPFWDVPELS